MNRMVSTATTTTQALNTAAAPARTLSSIVLRALTVSLKLTSIGIYSVAVAMIELLWNVFDGAAPANLIDGFSLPLMMFGAIAGLFFVRTTPRAQKLYVNVPQHVLAQAGAGVVWTSIGYLFYYLFVALLNVPSLPSSLGTLYGILATPVIIVVNALPITLLVGSITGTLTGLMLMKLK
jgi:hypothetical protein